jgi:uncharacterized membrane protein (DUF373 family)
METKGIYKEVSIIISILGVTLLVGAIIYLLFAKFSNFLSINTFSPPDAIKCLVRNFLT